MKARISHVLALAALTVTGGCASRSLGSHAQPSWNELYDVEQLHAETSDAVSNYRAAVTSPGATLAGCRLLHDVYDGMVRPWIGQLNQDSNALDPFVADQDCRADADIGCVAQLMLCELDRHRAAACASGDLAVDQQEVTRHATAMAGFLDHLAGRCKEIVENADGVTMSWTPALPACLRSTASCEVGPSVDSSGTDGPVVGAAIGEHE